MDTITKINKGARNNGKSATPDSVLYVIYGSRTGNSKAAATLAHEYSDYLGMETDLLDMKTFRFETLKRMKNILIAVSTHGEGDPPAVVEDFYRFMHSSEAPSMSGVNFSVLAMGDSSYKDFCKTGWDFRNRMLELGAKEISPLVECDIDYEENAKKWVTQAVSAFEKVLPKIKSKEKKEFAFELNKPELEQGNAFYAKVLEKRLLTTDGFKKRTLHFSLSMENFGTKFYPGDSFGVYTSNSRLLVDKLLKKLRFDGAHTISLQEPPKLLKESLLSDYEITLVTPVVLKKYAEVAQNEDLNQLLLDEEKMNSFCENHDIIDLVTLYPTEITPEQLLSCLRKLSPRLYSVASSPLVFTNELHLTAGIIDYELNKRTHKGVCSTFLDERSEVGDSIPVFYEPNEIFRLPDDDSIPVIMIATGTGIAPFRAFLQEREHKGAKGENWLIFGDRYAGSDFLYSDEMNYYHKSGLLSKMDLAFSREQDEKKYVQHCMLEKSRELFGLSLTFCGVFNFKHIF
ncbi:sulfite reductase flavoprotein subunit alpha [Mariniphaga sp.]|uniref:diflavin oxidoreductase n=1 Tax=Mariniphaga sp. TaxID=1954475 RepID=UPI003568AD3D